MGGRERWAAAG